MPRRILFGDKKCAQCGRLFRRGRLQSGRLESVEDFKKRKFCCRKCYFKYNTGPNHWLWKGPTKIRKDGYIRYNDDRYVHRVMMEDVLKRKLKSDEFIHHINGDTSDNRIENLEIISNSRHRKLHVKNQNRDKNGRFCL